MNQGDLSFFDAFSALPDELHFHHGLGSESGNESVQTAGINRYHLRLNVPEPAPDAPITMRFFADSVHRLLGW